MLDDVAGFPSLLKVGGRSCSSFLASTLRAPFLKCCKGTSGISVGTAGSDEPVASTSVLRIREAAARHCLGSRSQTSSTETPMPVQLAKHQPLRPYESEDRS